MQIKYANSHRDELISWFKNSLLCIIIGYGTTSHHIRTFSYKYAMHTEHLHYITSHKVIFLQVYHVHWASSALSFLTLLFCPLFSGHIALIHIFTPKKWNCKKKYFYSIYTYIILCIYIKYKKDKWDRTYNIYLSEIGLIHLKWLSPLVSTFLQMT